MIRFKNARFNRGRPAANAFGSNHRAGWNVACADGAVRTVAFAIDPAAHKALASRRNADIITIPW